MSEITAAGKLGDRVVATKESDERAFTLANGGFRPVFNAQLAVNTATLITTGVDLIDSGSDMNQMLPMHEQRQEPYARMPQKWLTDGGFARHGQIEPSRNASSPKEMKFGSNRVGASTRIARALLRVESIYEIEKFTDLQA